MHGIYTVVVYRCDGHAVVVRFSSYRGRNDASDVRRGASHRLVEPTHLII